MTEGEKVVKFIEHYCRVPEGMLLGQPIRLEPFQKKFIHAVYDNPLGTHTGVLSIGRKNGKCLYIDTPIPTPSGWRTMGDLEAGDYVYDTQGKPVRVLATSVVFKDKKCYRVGFSDGSEIIASDDHVWTTWHKYRPWEPVSTYSSGKPRGNGSGYGRKKKLANVTTAQIAESLNVKRNDDKTERNHSVGVAAPLESKDIELPIDPYVLGLWLGDGTSASSEISCGRHDVDAILPEVKKRLGDTVWCSYPPKGKCPTIRTPKTGFREALRATGLKNNKHIPEIYFSAGTAQRWELLQGLMDSDGTVTKGPNTPRPSFSGIRKNLVEGVWRLARSLGLKARVRDKVATLYGRVICDAWEVSFTASRDQPIFKLERQQRLLSPSIAARSKSVQIVSCDEVETVPTKCIMVDSEDHLYLAGHGCIPTHNTALIAGILLAHLVGPRAVQNSQIVSGAMSREQAALVFGLAVKMINLNPELQNLVHVIPSGKRLIGKPLNVEYRALSAEGKTTHGLSPILAILDETGQVSGPQDDFVDAITTAQGAHKNPLLMCISTQAANDADLLSVWIDDALASKDPRIVCHLYAADKDAAVDDREAWKAANPALGTFRSLEDVEKQAEKAKRMPSFENTFRNLVLNQRVSTVAPFISRSVWDANGSEPCPLRGLSVFGGLDLSMRTDLTALVLVGKLKDVWNIFPMFWTPEEGLMERAKRDRWPYDQWVREGFLKTTPGATVDYAWVLDDIAQLMKECRIEAIGYDRYRIDMLKRDAEAEGIILPLVEHGQGFKDMAPALDTLEAELLNGRMRHGNNPVLTMCAAGAVVTKDPAGNRKLDKSKATSRIDGMVALAMAMRMATMEEGSDIDDFMAAIRNPIIL